MQCDECRDPFVPYAHSEVMGLAEPSRSAEAAARVPGESPGERVSILHPPEAPVTRDSFSKAFFLCRPLLVSSALYPVAKGHGPLRHCPSSRDAGAPAYQTSFPTLKDTGGEAVFSPPVLDREISSVIEVSVPARGSERAESPGDFIN